MTRKIQRKKWLKKNLYEEKFITKIDAFRLATPIIYYEGSKILAFAETRF